MAMRKARKMLVKGNASRQLMPRITCGSSAMSDSPFLTQKSVKITVPVRPHRYVRGGCEIGKSGSASRACSSERGGIIVKGVGAAMQGVIHHHLREGEWARGRKLGFD